MILERREEYAQLLRWAGALTSGWVVNPQKFVSFFQFKLEFRRMTHCVSLPLPVQSHLFQSKKVFALKWKFKGKLSGTF